MWPPHVELREEEWNLMTYRAQAVHVIHVQVAILWDLQEGGHLLFVRCKLPREQA